MRYALKRMGLFSRRRRTAIVLEFVDADSGKPLYRSDSLPGDLPETFADPTSVQIQGVEHDVVKAVPAEAVEFRRSGRLKLWVRRRLFVPLNRILFSLPTISDRLPPTGAPRGAGKDVLTLPGDEWRQVEFVSREQAEQVAAGLQEIRRVQAESRIEWGWSRMFLRKEPQQPLGSRRIPLADVLRRFRTDVRRYDGLAIKGEEGQVEEGFALETGALLTLYGRVRGEEVRELCLRPGRGGAGDAAALVALAESHDLLLVDWCRAELIPAEAGAIRRWLAVSPVEPLTSP